MALVAVGGEGWLARGGARVRRLVTSATVGAAAVLAVFGLQTWDAAFNAGYRVRSEAVEAIPPGPFLAIDGAAWRGVAGRAGVVTPAGGGDVAAWAAGRDRAQSR